MSINPSRWGTDSHPLLHAVLLLPLSLMLERDGTLEVRKGRAEIRKLVLKFHDRADFPGHQHQMAQFVFDPDPQGRAQHWVVRSYGWATINRPPQPPHLHWCGHIRDVVAKVDGVWLIRAKAIMGWTGEVLSGFASRGR